MRLSLLLLLSCLGFAASALASGQGWHILRDGWNQKHPLDFATIEWEYFMIHDHEGKFNGIVGYVLTNPRSSGGPVKGLMPRGGNVAIGGSFFGEIPVAEYINFGTEGLVANGQDKNSTFTKDDLWSSITEADNGDLILAGDTAEFAWSFRVSQLLPELTANALPGMPFSIESDDKVGKPGEVWTLDALWPKTKVTGTIFHKTTGELVEVDGKGYRENSFGRYLMPLDGWDFLVFSEDADDGVTFVVQTYHKSKKLDFMDLAFYEGNHLKKLRIGRDNLKWRHREWTWSEEAHQCVPLDWEISGETDGYRIEADVQMPMSAQKPFLHDDQLGTRIFFIQEQYPTVTGTITRISDGEVVTHFSGQAGGEFAKNKGILPVTDWQCRLWGRKFSHR